MLILLPVILMFFTALVLLILRLVRPKFKYPWMIASGRRIAGACQCVSLANPFPAEYFSAVLAPGNDISNHALPGLPTEFPGLMHWPWQHLPMRSSGPRLCGRKTNSMPWAGTLTLSALGILAVAAENPLTLLLAWSAIDLFELITMLRSTEGESQTEGVIIAFAVRLAGTGLGDVGKFDHVLPAGLRWIFAPLLPTQGFICSLQQVFAWVYCLYTYLIEKTMLFDVALVQPSGLFPPLPAWLCWRAFRRLH